MKRILAKISLLALSLGLSACLEMTSVITVNKDGSATIEETVLLSAQMKAMMSAAGPQGGAPDPSGPNLKDLVPDKAKAEARAKKFGDGVTVKSYETLKMPDGREGVKVTYAVEDITDLEYQAFDSASPPDASGGSGGNKPMTFDLDDDELTVTLPPNDKKDAPAQPDKPKLPKDQMDAQIAMMKPMFAGMRMALKIKAGSGIASTDAANVDGDTVTLMDLQFDKIMENNDAFTKFMDTMDDKGMTPAKAAEKFKGVNGIQIEPKEEISIKLK